MTVNDDASAPSTPADHWRDSGVRVIPADQLDVNTAQSPGMNRAAAINFARVGAQKIWAGTVHIHANAKTGAHHHGPLESVIYVLKGRARMRWGDRLEFVAEAGPGDFIYVPPYVPHQEINASADETLECVLVRSDNEAVVVNLDIPPAEKPESVAWIDPNPPRALTPVGPVPTLAALIGVNLVVWLWAVAAFAHQPALLGTALLAYVFGVRHAFDADHIAAIDNVVRGLAGKGRQSHLIGLFFALGHSTVVVMACIAVAFATNAAKARLHALQSDGGAVGSLISASFLLAIGAVNLVALRRTWRVFGATRRGESPVGQDLDAALENHGVIARLFRPLFNMAARPWHMFPIGFLFGLGFDTATEVGLLGISAAEATRSMSPTTLLGFPALFTAGMALMDTSDSVLMTRVYGWAFVHPLRKLWFNLTTTAASVAAALIIAALELIGLWTDHFCRSALCAQIGASVESLNVVGIGLVGLFILCWAASVLIYRRNGYDDLAAAPANPS